MPMRRPDHKPSIRPELLDARGNLRARDIGITWQDGDTFLHGVRITGQKDDMEDNHRRPATAAPYPPCPEKLEDARRQPVMSTPYHQSHEHPPGGMSTPGFPRPVCIEMSDTPTHHFAGPRQEGRPAHRPAAPIQRFNSKSIGWPDKEQFVRGQSDPELKKYLWVVIRTQKDKKTTDTNRSLYGLRQFESYDQCSPSGGAGVRVRGGGRSGGGDVRRGGPTAVEHTEGGGTTFVTGAATDVRSCALHGLRDATDRATLRRSSTGTGPSIVPE